MTKRDLLKALETCPEDTKIGITLPGQLRSKETKVADVVEAGVFITTSGDCIMALAPGGDVSTCSPATPEQMSRTVN